MSSQDVYTAIRTANVNGPTGGTQGPERAELIRLNGQITRAAEYGRLVLKSVDGATVRLSDVAEVVDSVANTKLAAWDGTRPAILMNITRTAGANVIETVDRVKAELPQLLQWIPPDITVRVMSDRTGTIRASVHEVQFTLLLSIAFKHLAIRKRQTVVAVSGVGVGVGVVLRLAGPALVAYVVGVSALSGVGALGAWLPGPLAAPALTVLAGVLAVMATPGIATRAAGLTVPRVPTAGEEFDRSDDYQPDVDARSADAATIASAISAAIATCCVPALLWVGRAGGAWPFALCLTVAGALVVYASRHHWAVPRVCLTSVALAAVVAAAAAAAHLGHPAAVALALLVALSAAATVVWAPRVPDLEPTTVVWFERAEIAATIAVIPLAVHLAGVFDMIRGL